MTRFVIFNHYDRKPIPGKFRATAAVRDRGSCSCGGSCSSCRSHRDEYSYVYEKTPGQWWANVNGRERGPFSTRAKAWEAKLAGE